MIQVSKQFHWWPHCLLLLSTHDKTISNGTFPIHICIPNVMYPINRQPQHHKKLSIANTKNKLYHSITPLPYINEVTNGMRTDISLNMIISFYLNEYHERSVLLKLLIKK